MASFKSHLHRPQRFRQLNFQMVRFCAVHSEYWIDNKQNGKWFWSNAKAPETSGSVTHSSIRIGRTLKGLIKLGHSIQKIKSTPSQAVQFEALTTHPKHPASPLLPGSARSWTRQCSPRSCRPRRARTAPTPPPPEKRRGVERITVSCEHPF